MSIRVGINGFGRIGRLTCRLLLSRPEEFEVSLINDLAEPQSLVNLLKYDTVYGPFPGDGLWKVTGCSSTIGRSVSPRSATQHGSRGRKPESMWFSKPAAPSGPARAWKSTWLAAPRRSCSVRP